MTRLAAAVTLALAAVPAVAQPFPAPGTGVFTWERVGDRPLDIESFSFAPGGSLVGASPTDSIYAFEPNPTGPPAGRWRTLSRRGVAEAVFALDADADTLFVGHGNGGLLSRSTDGGRTWVNVNVLSSPEDDAAPITPAGFSVVPPGYPHSGRLLAGGAVIYSDDRGATWLDAVRSMSSGSLGFAHVFATLPSGRVLMGSTSGLAASDDGGSSYTVTPLWGPYVHDGLAALATPGSTQAGPPSCGLADTALCDGAVAVGLDATAPDMRAWRTNDGGRTWSAAVPLPEPYDGVGNGYTAGVVAVGTGADGRGRAITVLGRGIVYATADGGQTWQAVGRMPLDLALGVHWPQLVRLGPDGHLWVSTIINGPEREWMYRSAEPASAAFPVAGETPPVPSGGLGVSVRPNPTGGRVQVVVSLAAAQAVRVVVLDALGREVAVVLDGETAAGERVASVDTGAWPSGVYVVRAAAGATVASARLVVAR